MLALSFWNNLNAFLKVTFMTRIGTWWQTPRWSLTLRVRFLYGSCLEISSRFIEFKNFLCGFCGWFACLGLDCFVMFYHRVDVFFWCVFQRFPTDLSICLPGLLPTSSCFFFTMLLRTSCHAQFNILSCFLEIVLLKSTSGSPWILLATLHLDVDDKIKLETMNNKVPKIWFFIPAEQMQKGRYGLLI